MHKRTLAILAGASAAAIFADNRFFRIALEAPGEGGSKSIADLAKEIKEANSKAVDAVKALAEKAMEEAKSAGAGAVSAKESIDEALIKMNETSARLLDLEQKAARAPGAPEAAKSAGEMFVENDKVKAWLSAKGRDRVRVDVKANNLTSLTTDAGGSVGDAIRPTRLPGILAPNQRRLTVRDLVMPGNMDGSALEYVKETGWTNSAAPVAEGAAKPKSDIKFDLMTTSARVIAHHVKASRQVLDDISQLRSYIDGRLRYGLALIEENELLSGDGTGQHLLGMVPQATAYNAGVAPAGVTATSRIDMLRVAMLQAVLAEYPATGHVLNPIDWTGIELLKDDVGRYIIGNPQGSIAPTLWGLPVVATQAMAVDKFLTGAFAYAAQIFDRWDATVEAGYENDDFTKNMVTLLCEERLAFAVYRPESFIYGDFGGVA